jgi:hypothetical protein
VSVELPFDDVAELSEYDQLVKVVEEAVDAAFLAEMAEAFERRGQAIPRDESPAAAIA